MDDFRMSAEVRPDSWPWIKTGLVALSFSNLLFLPIWRRILYGEYYDYFSAPNVRRLDSLGAMLGVILAAGFLFVLFRLLVGRTSRAQKVLSGFGVLVLMAIGLNGLRMAFNISFHTDPLFYVFAICALGLGLAAIRAPRRTFQAAIWCLVAFSPYTIVTFGGALRNVVSVPDELPVLGHQAPHDNGGRNQDPRVIFIVFDEWDQTILFERRPPSLHLPNLDRLLAGAVTATRAYPPAGSTLESMPGLLTGQVVRAGRIERDATLLFQSNRDEGWRDLRQCDSMISDVLRIGKRATVYGWYHPYDRLFPASPNLTADAWPVPFFQGFGGGSVVSCAVAQIKFLAVLGNQRYLHRDNITELHSMAMGAVADPSCDLLFLHYGIPHGPGIFDGKAKRFSAVPVSFSVGYVGNLFLVDRYIGELLEVLASSGLAKRTSLILTADHWWRRAPWAQSEDGHRVPLIVRIMGDSTPGAVNSVICTSSLRKVVAEIIGGEIRTNSEVVGRLEREKTSIPKHYRRGNGEVED